MIYPSATKDVINVILNEHKEITDSISGKKFNTFSDYANVFTKRSDDILNKLLKKVKITSRFNQNNKDMMYEVCKKMNEYYTERDSAIFVVRFLRDLHTHFDIE